MNSKEALNLMSIKMQEIKKIRIELNKPENSKKIVNFTNKIKTLKKQQSKIYTDYQKSKA